MKQFFASHDLTPKRIVLILVTIGVIMTAIDLVWLSLVANTFYKDQLGALVNPAPVVWAAAAFYLMYLGGVAYFAVIPALKAESGKLALINGAALGLVAYGTYDLTNMATVLGWPVALVFVDMAWGVFLTGTVAVASYAVVRRFK